MLQEKNKNLTLKFNVQSNLNMWRLTVKGTCSKTVSVKITNVVVPTFFVNLFRRLPRNGLERLYIC